MRTCYFAAFIPSEDGGYDIDIPDVPNAFTSADSLEEAFSVAEELLKLMLRDLVCEKKFVPSPSSLKDAKNKATMHLREIKQKPTGEILYQLIPAPNLDMAPVKVTISMPKAVLEEIDAKARRAGFTRSGFLAHAATRYGVNE